MMKTSNKWSEEGGNRVEECGSRKWRGEVIRKEREERKREEQCRVRRDSKRE